MQLPQLGNKFKWNYLALAFGIPVSLMLVTFFFTSVMPFGSYTTLYSDGYHQYFPFFLEFRNALRSGDSLLWNWSVGLGMEYLGLASYYVASPLNLLTVLLPESWMLPYFTLLMPIKLGFASLFFALMLKKLFGKDDLSISLFGSLYGMCAWALGYQWNIMWLDTFALLPLVALGTVLLLRDKKYVLYTITLTLSVISNYYIGFFVCIFVFLLFWCYEICRFKSIGRFCTDLFRIGVFTVLAIGLTAFLMLPTLASLQDTYATTNGYYSANPLNILSADAQSSVKAVWDAYKTAKEAGEAPFSLWLESALATIPLLLQAMGKVAGQIGGGLTPTYVDGMPNLYCGVLPISLGFLFLLDNNVKLRDKLCSVALLLLFMASIVIRRLDYIWHGFHFTNQIPYRFSFLFSFVLLYMAYQAWLHRSQLALWKIFTAGILALGLTFLNSDNWNDPVYILFNIAFWGLYLVCMLYGHPNFLQLQRALSRHNAEPAPLTECEPEAPLPSTNLRRSRASWAIAAVLLLELVLNTAIFIAGFSTTDYDYPKNEAYSGAFFDSIRQTDEQFYRTEVTHTQTLNDGALNGYYGISTFTSSANVKTTTFMNCLGFSAYGSWNRYSFETGSPVSNLFLNLKYMVERDTEPADNPYFDTVRSENDLYLLENNAYLPLGFLAESTLAHLSFNTVNSSFSFQNKLFTATTGVKQDVWYTLPNKQLTVTPNEELSVKSISGGHVSFNSSENSGSVLYTYSISKEGLLCLDITPGYDAGSLAFKVWHNQEDRSSSNVIFTEKLGYPFSQMMAVCQVQPGDRVDVEVTCNANRGGSISIKAAVLNEAVFRQGYEVLSASTLQLADFSNTRISGTIDCNRDGLLYTSIPQNGDWTAYVDGQPAEITLVGDCMVGLHLSEGSHTVEFKYVSPSFRLGGLITLGSGLVFGIILLADYLIRKKRA